MVLLITWINAGLEIIINIMKEQKEDLLTRSFADLFGHLDIFRLI